VEQGQEVTYVTERCVLQLTKEGVTVTEIAPGIDLQRDVLAQAGFELKVAGNLQVMPASLFKPEKIGLRLNGSASIGAGDE
jgi:acyl CoA:acetate/3-ketoacid CoA transferase